MLLSSLSNDLVYPVFDGVGLAGFKSRSNAFFSCSLLFCLQLFSLYLLFLDRLVVWAGVFGLIGCQSPSPGLALSIFFNKNYNNLNYCSSIWGKSSEKLQYEVQECINFAAKVASNGKYLKRDHVTPLLRDLK